MKSVIQSRSHRVSRWTTKFLRILALVLVPWNVVRAQFPEPDHFDPGANELVAAFAVQADGKILVGGGFSTLDGQRCDRIGRLHVDGTLDESFDAGFGNRDETSVITLVVQADGRILVGGRFFTVGGQPRSCLARLNEDGTLDGSFNPGAEGYSGFVNPVVIQADGEILVGGSFSTLGGLSRDRIGRLHANGTVDGTFNPGADHNVRSLAVQADGRILVAGDFSVLGGQSRGYIGRIHKDGTLDDTFNPAANGGAGCLAVQADGKILVGGSFTSLNGQRRDRIARLNPDGTLDSSFNPGANAGVRSLMVQADGNILVGGDFTVLGGQPRRHIARIFPDGTSDVSFNPGANNLVYSLAVQTDGKILAGGHFTTLGGKPRRVIGRLNSTHPATQSLVYDGTTIIWLRGGSSPETSHTTFEHSLDGRTWTALGVGVRIPGGWRLTGVSLPLNGTLRARGRVSAGYGNNSSGVVETTLSAPWPLRVRWVRNGAIGNLSWPRRQGPHQVQQTKDLSQPDSWKNVGAPVQDNSVSLPLEGETVFLRVQGP